MMMALLLAVACAQDGPQAAQGNAGQPSATTANHTPADTDAPPDAPLAATGGPVDSPAPKDSTPEASDADAADAESTIEQTLDSQIDRVEALIEAMQRLEGEQVKEAE